MGVNSHLLCFVPSVPPRLCRPGQLTPKLPRTLLSHFLSSWKSYHPQRWHWFWKLEPKSSYFLSRHYTHLAISSGLCFRGLWSLILALEVAPGTHLVGQIDFTPNNVPASASQVLRLHTEAIHLAFVCLINLLVSYSLIILYTYTMFLP